MKGKLATYKYGGVNTPKFVFGSVFEGLSGMLAILVVIAVFVYLFTVSDVSPGLLFVAAVILLIVSVQFFSAGPGLIVSSKYLVFGTNTILYENIASISIDEAKLVFMLERENGQVIVISADKFDTNARKDWKIKLNKKEKFIKVASKILGYAIKENDSMELKMSNADRLAKYRNLVNS